MSSWELPDAVFPVCYHFEINRYKGRESITFWQDFGKGFEKITIAKGDKRPALDILNEIGATLGVKVKELA
jgi:hypothetical protein